METNELRFAWSRTLVIIANMYMVASWFKDGWFGKVSLIGASMLYFLVAFMISATSRKF